ncbi:sigma-70 family RNA polymerase sigma factor [Echinicola sediminis]
MKSQELWQVDPQSPQGIRSLDEKNESEARLWLEYLGGSDAALAEIYRLYSKKLFQYGRQFTSSDEFIYDAIQDVFIYLVDAREKLSVAKSVKFYLYSVFRRTLMKSLEKNRKVISAEEDALEGFLISMANDYRPVQEQLSERHKTLLMKAVNQLPLRQREMLNLRFFEGLSYEQIAAVMDLANAKTVRTMMYRSFSKLNKVLSPLKQMLYTLPLIGTFL